MTLPLEGRRINAIDFVTEHGSATAREFADARGKTTLQTASGRLGRLCAAGRLTRRMEPGGYRYWLSGTTEPPPSVFVRPPGTLRSETVVLLAIAREPFSTPEDIAQATGLISEQVIGALALLERCDAVDRKGSCYHIP